LQALREGDSQDDEENEENEERQEIIKTKEIYIQTNTH
jgi:hypothetical protein